MDNKVEPVLVTVDKVFEILDAALGESIELRGDPAKAIAWDIRQHFLAEMGYARSAHLTAEQCDRASSEGE